MKQIRRFIYAVSVMILLFCSQSSASHIIGGELTYQWLSGTRYVFTLTLFRDCAGIPAPNSGLISITSVSCNLDETLVLNEVPGTGQQFTPICPGTLTFCNGGTSPGFQQWRYTNTIDIGKRCTDWVFSYQLCCRNVATTTIQNPNTSTFYIEATLDNLDDSIASSPVFTDNPKIILCVGQPVVLSNGATDYNGDSLVSSFTTPKQTAATYVLYNSPYTAENPIASDPPATIDPQSGNIYVTPTIVQVGITSVLVKKYHNGIIVGTVARDVEFNSTVCAAEDLPTATGIDGGASFDTTICPGSNLSFNVFSNDTSATDTVSMSWNGSLPGATFITTDSVHPSGTLSWTPTLTDGRFEPYSFLVTVSNNVCPYNGFQNYTYSIYVSPIRAKFSIHADSTLLHHYIVSDSSTFTNAVTYDWSWGDGSADDYTHYPSHTYDTAGFYNICLSLTNPEGCTSTFCDSSFRVMRTTNTMIEVDVVPANLVTGIKPTDAYIPDVKISPNPAFNLLTIHPLILKNEHTSLYVMNMIGEEVLPPASFQMEGQDISLDISNLSTGMYFLKLISESGNVVKMFVKE